MRDVSSHILMSPPERGKKKDPGESISLSHYLLLLVTLELKEVLTACVPSLRAEINICYNCYFTAKYVLTQRKPSIVDSIVHQQAKQVSCSSTSW